MFSDTGDGDPVAPAPAEPALQPARPAEATVRRVAGSRRVIRPGNAEADPTPHYATSRLEEDPERPAGAPGAGSSANDEQLKSDKPPHWG